MPGNIPLASPGDAFPEGIHFRSFSGGSEWVILENTYRRGEVQVSCLVTNSRKGPWRLVFRGTVENLATLREFYDAHGMTTPFYFTPLHETTKTARFNSAWQQFSRPGFCEATLEIIEIL